MMAIPGLVLFYGGLVRAKNMASVLTQVFVIVSVVALIWVCWGYSLAFTSGNPFVGGLDKMFLRGVDATTLAGTFSNGVYIPEYAFVAFQMTFARSEEHTSELQSLMRTSYAVFCLKKKNTRTNTY